MSEQTNMNRGMLKEKLGNYRADPPEKVWNAIAGQLDNGRRRRRMYILMTATAASVALAVGLGIHYFVPDLPQQQSGIPEQVIEEQVVPDSRTAEDARGVQDQIAMSAAEGLDQVPEDPAGNVPFRVAEAAGIPERSDREETYPEAEIFHQEEAGHVTENLDQVDTGDPEKNPDPEENPDRVADSEPDTTLEIFTDPFPGTAEAGQRKSRWMVGAAVSPLYSYRDANEMAMSNGQAESGLLSYSTGVHVRYRRNSRLAIETGIYYNRTGIAIGAPGIRVFSQAYDNMLFGFGSESADINNINNSVGNIVAYSGDIYLNGYKITAENGIDAVQSGVVEDAQLAEAGIQQHLDFLELPFNLRYSVIDRAFELQLVGGVSTNFLVGNSVTLEGPSGREEIGYLTNVNTVNYSGNAGLGMVYHMGRNLSLMLEPRFRYFLNSVNDASLPATRPYSLGFYTGLSYTF